MGNLKRFELKLTLSLKYFKFSLKGMNTLCDEILNIVNFEMGSFFTLLPDDVDEKKLYEFKCGGMAKGVQDLIEQSIYQKLNQNNHLTCIFDDAISDYSSMCNEDFFISHGLSYKDEVYYYIAKSTNSLELINQCFNASNAMWHSLCMLTRINFNIENKKKLTMDEIKLICESSELILIEAYDGEGYVFWEKKDASSFFSNLSENCT